MESGGLYEGIGRYWDTLVLTWGGVVLWLVFFAPPLVLFNTVTFGIFTGEKNGRSVGRGLVTSTFFAVVFSTKTKRGATGSSGNRVAATVVGLDGAIGTIAVAVDVTVAGTGASEDTWGTSAAKGFAVSWIGSSTGVDSVTSSATESDGPLLLISDERNSVAGLVVVELFTSWTVSSRGKEFSVVGSLYDVTWMTSVTGFSTAEDCSSSWESLRVKVSSGFINSLLRDERTGPAQPVDNWIKIK